MFNGLKYFCKRLANCIQFKLSLETNEDSYAHEHMFCSYFLILETIRAAVFYISIIWLYNNKEP